MDCTSHLQAWPPPLPGEVESQLPVLPGSPTGLQPLTAKHACGELLSEHTAHTHHSYITHIAHTTHHTQGKQLHSTCICVHLHVVCTPRIKHTYNLHTQPACHILHSQRTQPPSAECTARHYAIHTSPHPHRPHMRRPAHSLVFFSRSETFLGEDGWEKTQPCRVGRRRVGRWSLQLISLLSFSLPSFFSALFLFLFSFLPFFFFWPRNNCTFFLPSVIKKQMQILTQ